MSEKFVSKALDENGDGLDVYRIVQLGIGGTSGMVTDDSETLYNLESERITLHSIVTQMIVTAALYGSPKTVC